MPKDNIDRAVKRGTGESKDGAIFEQVAYEGYASHAVALLIECVTDNRNRTVADIRHVLNKFGGSLGEAGSVAWQFTRVAHFLFPAEGLDEDDIFELAIEGGADDINFDEETIEIIGPVECYKDIGDRLRDAGIQAEEAGLRMMPNQEIELDPDQTVQVMKVIETLEDLDDVQSVSSNLAISDEAMVKLEMA
jgi:YebC/PmpR family DNA-binding regulatory protein